MRRRCTAFPLAAMTLALLACGRPPPPVTSEPTPHAPVCPPEATSLLDAVIAIDELLHDDPSFSAFETAVARAEGQLARLDLDRLPNRCEDLVVAPAENATVIYSDVLARWRDCGGAIAAQCPFSDFWASVQDSLAEASELVDVAARHAAQPLAAGKRPRGLMPRPPDAADILGSRQEPGGLYLSGGPPRLLVLRPVVQKRPSHVLAR
jgi:hypothetical protein